MSKQMDNDPGGIRQHYAQAVDALNRRQWARARAVAEPLLARHPQHGGMHFIVGVAALELKDMKAAFRHLLMATRLSPERADYAAQWARVLLECHQQKQALEQADRAMALEGRDPVTLNTLAVIYTRCNAHARAADAFRRASQRAPDQPGLYFNLTTSLMATGDIEAAIRECERCLQVAPDFWPAYLLRSQLARQTGDSNHLVSLHECLAVAGDRPEALLYLNLALEKEYDDLGQYERAFAHLKAGKDAWKCRLDRSGPADEELFDLLIETVSGLGKAGSGHRDPTPIFVIGMPRSGTTLVERIVSSHSRVHSAGELQNFPVQFKRASGVYSAPNLDAETLSAVRRIDWERLGREYIESTRPMAGGKPHFIDKLPQNFLYAAFIARALPDARIVCLRRDPMDTCIANYRQLFNLSSAYYNYSFDLVDTGRYYLGFDRLMKLYRRLMPGRILEVGYEDIVGDQEQASRTLIAHCGLDWEDACLDFENNQAPVATASAVQVRSPIYRSSLQRWKRYGHLVDDLRELLRRGGVDAGMGTLPAAPADGEAGGRR
ncbi:MAG: sulfotransferase [Pseudoxanthomonas sp.]